MITTNLFGKGVLVLHETHTLELQDKGNEEPKKLSGDVERASLRGFGGREQRAGSSQTQREELLLCTLRAQQGEPRRVYFKRCCCAT